MHAAAGALLLSANAHCDDSPPALGCADAQNSLYDAPANDANITIHVTVETPDCPKVTEIVAMPYVVLVGDSASVTATVSMTDAGAPTLRWAAPTGTFGDPSAAATTFTCTAPGAVDLTFVASLGGCRNAADVPVECRAPTP